MSHPASGVEPTSILRKRCWPWRLRYHGSDLRCVVFRKSCRHAGDMKKQKSLVGLGIATVVLAGCTGSEEPELAIMNASQEQEIPERVNNVGEEVSLQNHTFVGRGEDFSVFAARDEKDHWSVSSSCGASQDFANGEVWVQGGSPSRTQTALLLPDNYSGDIDADLERVNDNLAAK